MKVGIIGLGLIGGSMAIDLKRKGFAEQILGVESEPVNAAAAEKIGLVDRVVSLEDCLSQSDVVVLAVPVGMAVRLLPQVLDTFARSGAADKVVMDVCSTKEHLARSVKYHPSAGSMSLRILWPERNTAVIGRRCQACSMGMHASYATARSHRRRL